MAWGPLAAAGIIGGASILGSVLGGGGGGAPKQGPTLRWGEEMQDMMAMQNMADLDAWGSPLPQMMTETQPGVSRKIVERFGGRFNPSGGGGGGGGVSISGGLRGLQNPDLTFPGQPQAGAYQGMPQDVNRQPAMQTLGRLRKPKVRFGYGGGNFGNPGTGYGGPLSVYK